MNTNDPRLRTSKDCALALLDLRRTVTAAGF
jgi:hypothetical protein